MISLIAAIGKNYEIGKDNDLMWTLKDDMKLFMDTTMHHVIIMGRKSYDALGKALRNRENVVVTRNRDFNPEDARVFYSLEDAIAAYNKDDEEIFIIGGGEIYKQSMNVADRLYLTHVDAEFPSADTFFPEFNADEFEVIKEEFQPANERNEHSYTFRLYERK